jgi:hypothetical protein
MTGEASKIMDPRRNPGQQAGQKTLLTFSFRAHRLARAIADKTSHPSFNRASRELWLVTYRNAFDAAYAEGPLVSRRVAIVGSIAGAAAAFGLGLLLKGAL